MFLKYTPETNHAVTTEMFDKSAFCKLKQRDIDPLYRYMESLQIHKEYLDFFQIGVYRDQKSKIEKVAKYVGLAMPNLEPFIYSDRIFKD